MYSNIKRLYVDEMLKINSLIVLTGRKHHYLKNVIRINQDDFIRLFNGKEGEWLSRVTRVDKKNITLNVEKKLLNQQDSLNLWLFFAPIKINRLNILVQKSTELGVSKFFPIKTKRTNLKNLNINNLKQNAISASEQSGRLNIPIIENEKEIRYINNSLLSNRCLIYCDEKSLKVSSITNTMNKINKKFTKWALLIGPEGGFSDDERKKIMNLNNAYSVSLGKRILRSDTAAIAALFYIQQFIDSTVNLDEVYTNST